MRDSRPRAHHGPGRVEVLRGGFAGIAAGCEAAMTAIDDAPHRLSASSAGWSSTATVREIVVATLRWTCQTVIAVEGGAHGAIVHLEGGGTVALAGLFVATRMQVVGPFAAALGCAIETHPMGSFYQTDPMTKETTAPGVFACGDAAVPMGALPFAVADGFRAGVGVHRSLVFPS